MLDTTRPSGRSANQEGPSWETVARFSPGAEGQIVAGADGLEGGRQAARELLASNFHPTAILCVNEKLLMAVGVLRELRDQGIRVPNDISVTGFDNIKLAKFRSPALTTVHIPREQIGQTIFKICYPTQNESRLPAAKSSSIRNSSFANPRGLRGKLRPCRAARKSVAGRSANS